MLNVVVLNGGRGASSLIPELLDRQGLYVTSVVNAYDDGKSTGNIRSYFGMLGPSDIRKVQQLMLPKDDLNYDSYNSLFDYRFSANQSREDILASLHSFAFSDSSQLCGITIVSQSILASLRLYMRSFLDGLRLVEQVQNRSFSFDDCSIMNCVYAGAFLSSKRNLERATTNIDRLFRLRGLVLPTSNDNLYLVALRENGEMLYSEAEIVELRSNVRIERVFLLDHQLDRYVFDKLSVTDKRSYLLQHHCPVHVSPGVRLALKQADIIIYSAGTQHSSLYPTYMATGLASTIADNRAALKVLITNIGADYETPSYRASDYVAGALSYLNLSDSRHIAPEELISYVLANIPRNLTENHIQYDAQTLTKFGLPILPADYENHSGNGKHNGNLLVTTILDLYEATYYS